MSLQLPKGSSQLLESYEAARTVRTQTGAELEASYQLHFQTSAPAPVPGTTVFERFSLVDPTVRTVVRSNTEIV